MPVVSEEVACLAEQSCSSFCLKVNVLRGGTASVPTERAFNWILACKIGGALVKFYNAQFLKYL